MPPPFGFAPAGAFDVTMLLASKLPTFVPLTYNVYVFPACIFAFEIVITPYDFSALKVFIVLPELSFSSTLSPALPDIWKLKEYCVELFDGF